MWYDTDVSEDHVASIFRRHNVEDRDLNPDRRENPQSRQLQHCEPCTLAQHAPVSICVSYVYKLFEQTFCG